MTQKANPSPNRPASAFKTAGAIAYGGGATNGFVIDGAEPTELAVQDADIDHTVLDGFSETHSGSSFTVDIAPGEAFVFGSWLCIDTQTTVTLDSNTSGQTVYVGWDKNSSDDVIIGLDSAFASSQSDNDKRIALYEYDTDGSGATLVSDEKDTGQTSESSSIVASERLGVPLYGDSSSAPQEQGNIITVDGSGPQSEGVYAHDGTEYVKIGKSDEEIEDLLSALVSSGAEIDVTYDDSADRLTINNAAPYSDEKVEDAVDSLLVGGNSITLSYDDANNELTVNGPDGYSDEEAQDAVDTLLTAGDNISLTYDDVNDNLTVSLDDIVETNSISATSISADNGSIGTLETNSAVIGTKNVEKTFNTHETQFNELAIDVAQTQFETGLNELDYRNGVFDIFVDETRIDTLTDAVVDTSNEILKLNTTDSGTATYLDPDEDFVPDTAVLSVEGNIPTDATYKLELVDENGTTVTIPEADEDTIVDTSDIDTLDYEVRFNISRDAGTATPEIDDFAAYLDGSLGSYYDATIDSTTEA